jgi:hypothetical protein
MSHVERLALALATTEGTVNHARMGEVANEHPVDLTKALQHLVQMGMLESTGGRGAVYHLSGEVLPTPEDVFDPSSGNISSLPILDSSSTH